MVMFYLYIRKLMTRTGYSTALGDSAKLEGLHPDDKIWGHWMNKTDQELHYELLVEKKETAIKAVNLVCSHKKELGSLRVKKNVELKYGSRIMLPLSFDMTVLACLEEQGFLDV